MYSEHHAGPKHPAFRNRRRVRNMRTFLSNVTGGESSGNVLEYVLFGESETLWSPVGAGWKNIQDDQKHYGPCVR